MQTKSFLYGAWTGPDKGPVTLCFGGFLDEIEDVIAFAQAKMPDARTYCIRGPRSQTQGGNGVSCGHFWFIGQDDQPELSTFGDGLYQAEVMLLERSAEQKVNLAGRGQGATIAVTLGALWPDRVSSIQAWGGGLPMNLASMPLEFANLQGLQVALHGLSEPVGNFTQEALTVRGASCAIAA